MDTIQVEGWQGRLGHGLAPRQLEATLYAACDYRAKEIARFMGISPATVKSVLDDARFRLSKHPEYIRTVRGLIAEAMKRGIISPLVLLLCLSTGFTAMQDRTRPVRTAKVSVMRAYRQEVA